MEGGRTFQTEGTARLNTQIRKHGPMRLEPRGCRQNREGGSGKQLTEEALVSYSMLERAD